eukprot:1360724-Rhodomonas_salina.2
MKGLWDSDCLSKVQHSSLPKGQSVFGSHFHCKIKCDNTSNTLQKLKVCLVIQGNCMEEGTDTSRASLLCLAARLDALSLLLQQPTASISTQWTSSRLSFKPTGLISFRRLARSTSLHPQVLRKRMEWCTRCAGPCTGTVLG